jgi:hypothetical protein
MQKSIIDISSRKCLHSFIKVHLGLIRRFGDTLQCSGQPSRSRLFASVLKSFNGFFDMELAISVEFNTVGLAMLPEFIPVEA